MRCNDICRLVGHTAMLVHPTSMKADVQQSKSELADYSFKFREIIHACCNSFQKNNENSVISSLRNS